MERVTARGLSSNDAVKTAKILNWVLQSSNWQDVLQALRSGTEVPAIHLKNGIRIFHSADDDIGYSFFEIFGLQPYTGSGFYQPRQADTVVDIGANIGVFALHLAGLAPGIEVHCFEPAARARGRLLRNLAENQLAGKIHVYPFGVWSAPGPQRLMNYGFTGHGSVFHRDKDARSSEAIECVDLNRVLELVPAARVDLLKIDAEGAEVEIVQGARPELWRRIERVALEYHEDIRPGCRMRLRHLLTAAGYEVNGAPGPGGDGPYGVLLAKRR
ncbi:MAG: FkbM family methyltransferase [Bryobacterales bacterium]|nr:FkbM family methyltransferase [Bryobacterales bacterium]